MLESISDLMGYSSFFENFIQIACLLFAWALVLLAFFILAIQLFVTLIEFKLTTLAGFVLIPFGLFGKTAFMAERVLGNVVSSGIKVLVLAVIIGIGSTLFARVHAGFGGATPTIDDAMAIVLAALSLLGLGIFGPGIANGLSPAARSSARAPPLEPALPPAARCLPAARAAGLAAKGGCAALSGGAHAVRRGGAAAAGGASPPIASVLSGQSGAAGVAAGLGGVARAAGAPPLAAETRAARRRKRQVQLLRWRARPPSSDRRLLHHGHDRRRASSEARPRIHAGAGRPAWAQAHEAHPDHEPRRHRRRPCRPLRRQPWRRLLHQSFRK
jgi:type IV secretion system protein TrbL